MAKKRVEYFGWVVMCRPLGSKSPQDWVQSKFIPGIFDRKHHAVEALGKPDTDLDKTKEYGVTRITYEVPR